MYQGCEVRRSLMSAGWWPWAVYHSTTMVWHAKSAIHTNSIRASPAPVGIPVTVRLPVWATHQRQHLASRRLDNR
ncbi:hypothetical protein ABT072_35745 [Streptomyces sp. NPDC002589]|uniref:hypothetical protein n=1 Tax=Streptomyces sp. NPDC002589 TaxID=3154420 RepID=UPI00332148CB